MCYTGGKHKFLITFSTIDLANISRKAVPANFSGFLREHILNLSIEAVFFFEDDRSLLKRCLPLLEGCTEVWFKMTQRKRRQTERQDRIQKKKKTGYLNWRQFNLLINMVPFITLKAFIVPMWTPICKRCFVHLENMHVVVSK